MTVDEMAIIVDRGIQELNRLRMLNAELVAALHWCVENDGETLADNPRILEKARTAIAKYEATT